MGNRGQGGFGVTERNHNETASQYQDNCTDGLTPAPHCLLPPFPPQPPPPSVRPSSFFLFLSSCLLSSLFCILFPMIDRRQFLSTVAAGVASTSVAHGSGRMDGPSGPVAAARRRRGPGFHLYGGGSRSWRAPVQPAGPRRPRVSAAAARRHPPARLAAAAAATAGRRPERAPRRVLARRGTEPVVRRHRRRLGARAVLARRRDPPRVAARRPTPEGPHHPLRRLHRRPPARRRLVRSLPRGCGRQALRHVGDPARQQGAGAVPRRDGRCARARCGRQEPARAAGRPRQDAAVRLGEVPLVRGRGARRSTSTSGRASRGCSTSRRSSARRASTSARCSPPTTSRPRRRGAASGSGPSTW